MTDDEELRALVEEAYPRRCTCLPTRARDDRRFKCRCGVRDWNLRAGIFLADGE